MELDKMILFACPECSTPPSIVRARLTLSHCRTSCRDRRRAMFHVKHSSSKQKRDVSRETFFLEAERQCFT